MRYIPIDASFHPRFSARCSFVYTSAGSSKKPSQKKTVPGRLRAIDPTFTISGGVHHGQIALALIEQSLEVQPDGEANQMHGFANQMQICVCVL